MMAEIMGKRDGLDHGKVVPCVAEIDKGMLGANGIVSGGFGLATGAGISIRNQGKRMLLYVSLVMVQPMKVISMRALTLPQS